MGQELYSLQEILDQLNISAYEYRKAEVDTLCVLAASTPASDELERILCIPESTVAYTLRFAGAGKQSVIVEGVREDLSEWRHMGLVQATVLGDMLEQHQDLRGFPIGKDGRVATAVLLVDRPTRRMFVVQRSWYERLAATKLVMILDCWRKPQELGETA